MTQDKHNDTTPDLVESYALTKQLLKDLMPVMIGDRACEHPDTTYKRPCRLCVFDYYGELARVANYLSTETLRTGLREAEEGEYFIKAK